jgi:hypothetical protein
MPPKRRPDDIEDLEEIERSLGNLCLIADRPITHLRRKLPQVEPGSAESFYLCAAYCFDLQRKLEYTYIALRQFAGRADPRLARRLEADESVLNAKGLTWKQRAQRAERIMLKLYREIGQEHDRTVKRLARQASAPKARRSRAS